MEIQQKQEPMRETIETILLASACLFLAGLNLWNEFKDWFNKTYQRKDRCNAKDDNRNTVVSSVMGKSKTVFKSLPVNQNQKKEQEAVKEEDSIDLEKEAIPLNIASGQNVTHDQGVTVDEFQLLAGTLRGKAIPKEKELQIRETLQKMQGTDLFEQIVGKVSGAESIIVRMLDGMSEQKDNTEDSDNLFDIGKYVN